jgi:hypothetical protein
MCGHKKPAAAKAGRVAERFAAFVERPQATDLNRRWREVSNDSRTWSNRDHAVNAC